MAKDAQAKIEDILLTNKIEQLKAEGKLTEARAVERERGVKRTLAGMKGLSKEDKEKLAATMRQTDEYRDKQEQMRGASGGGGYGASASYSGGAGGAASSRGGGFGSSAYGGGYGGSFGGSARYSGPTPARRPRPATISAKYMGLYEEWQAAGGSKSGVSWIDYRNSRRGAVDAAEKARKAYGRTVAADANTPASERRERAAQTISGIESQAKEMASKVTIGGAVNAAANSVPNESPRKSPRTVEESENESSETKNRRVQSQTNRPQNTRQQTAQMSGGDVVKLLSSIDKSVKSIAST